MPVEAKRYARKLFDEINKDREDHGKPPFEDKENGSGEKEAVFSTTDPEEGGSTKVNIKNVGHMKRIRPAKRITSLRESMARRVMCMTSAVFDPLCDEFCETYLEHKVIIVESAYKTP